MAGLTAVAIVVGSLPTPATAEEPPFQVDLEVLTDRVLAAHVQVNGDASRGLERLLLSAELLEWRRLHPTAGDSELTHHLESMQDRLRDALPAQERARSESRRAMRGVAALVASSDSAAATAPHIRRLIEVALGKSIGGFDAREDLVSGALRDLDWLRARGEVEAEVWAGVRRRAQTDPVFESAWSQVLGEPSIQLTASLDQLKADPKLRPLVDVDLILAQQASRELFLAEIQRQFGLVAAALAAESVQARARLVALGASCPVAPDTSCTPEQRAAATARAEAEQKEIDAAATAVKLLGGLARIADIKSGEKIEKVATAWYSFVTSINTYAKAIAGRNAQDAILSGASLVLAGDILGAVMTLVGLLGESTPSLDQRIFDQIVQLRREVRALHQEMRDSFQRIETQLDTIFQAMMNEFDKLGAAVAGNTAQLIAIQNTLAQQGLRLESIAATILAAIGEVELHDTRSDVNRYIGYRETFNQPLPPAEYPQPENQFHLAATELSTHPAFVVPPSLAFDVSADPTAVLDQNGEAASLSYLARRATARDPRVPDPVQVLANPSVWSFAAQAYALLALQNPSLAAEVSVVRSQQIAFEGQRVQDVARSFSLPQAPPEEPLNPIFSTLASEYRGALGQLGAGLAAIRTQKVLPRKEPSGATFFNVSKSYDLFGSATQSIPESTLPGDPTVLRPCPASGSGPIPPGPQLSRPTNVSFKFVAPELRFAHYAYSPTMGETYRLPELAQCYEAGFVSLRESWSTLYHSTFGKLRLTMRTRFRWSRTNDGGVDETWRNARTATYTWPEMLIERECISIHCSGGSSTTVTEALTARYPRDKAIFQQSATVTNDTGFLAVARTEMNAFLAGRQRMFYALAAEEVSNAGTALQGSGATLARVARELQAYTRYGFPVALAGDDILSSLLFGRYPLLVNKPSAPQLASTLNVAYNRYVCAPAVDPGRPCYNGPFFPLRSQPHIETVGGVSVYDPVFCKAPTGGVPGLSGDPVGDCLVASGTQRVNALVRRYEHHSELLADGTYVERLPWVDGTMEILPLVNRIVHAGEPE